jgi:hypothetical protein
VVVAANNDSTRIDTVPDAAAPRGLRGYVGPTSLAVASMGSVPSKLLAAPCGGLAFDSHDQRRLNVGPAVTSAFSDRLPPKPTKESL